MNRLTYLLVCVAFTGNLASAAKADPATCEDAVDERRGSQTSVLLQKQTSTGTSTLRRSPTSNLKATPDGRFDDWEWDLLHDGPVGLVRETVNSSTTTTTLASTTLNTTTMTTTTETTTSFPTTTTELTTVFMTTTEGTTTAATTTTELTTVFMTTTMGTTTSATTTPLPTTTPSDNVTGAANTTANASACVTRMDPRVVSAMHVTSPPGTPCVFGVDDRDEGAHCIFDDGQYGSFGWCYTASDLSSWGSCAESCPLFGSAKVLGKRIEGLKDQLNDLKAQVGNHISPAGLSNLTNMTEDTMSRTSTVDNLSPIDKVQARNDTSPVGNSTPTDTFKDFNTSETAQVPNVTNPAERSNDTNTTEDISMIERH